MTTLQTTYHCDHSGCRSTCQLSPADETRAPDALRERGWAVRTAGPDADKHYCPAHRDEAA